MKWTGNPLGSVAVTGFPPPDPEQSLVRLYQLLGGLQLLWVSHNSNDPGCTLKVSFAVRRLRGDVNLGLNSISPQIYDVAILSFDDHGKIFQKGQIFLHSWMLVMDMREPNDSDCWSCHFTR